MSIRDLNCPEHIEVQLKKKCETQAKVAVDRCTGPCIHLTINDGNPGSVNPLAYETFGDKIVLLTVEEARQIGQRLLDFADNVEQHPDIFIY